MPYRVIFVCVMGFVNTTMHEFGATKYHSSVIIFTRVRLERGFVEPVSGVICICLHLSERNG